jgi:hypothetical protein
MESSLEMLINDEDFLTTDRAIQMLWKWRKYRNEAFWSSMYRLGTASIALSMLPYLLPDLSGKLGSAVLVFPSMAALLSLVGAYLMIVQYMLYKLVDRKYRAVLGKYNPGDIPETGLNRPFRISIGKILAGLFIFFAIIGQLINGMILMGLVTRP